MEVKFVKTKMQTGSLNNLIKVLKLLRTSQELSIAEVSEMVGLSTSYIYEIERGQKPTLSVIEKYANSFNIKPSTILFFSDEADEKKLTTQNLLLKILETLSKS